MYAKGLTVEQYHSGLQAEARKKMAYLGRKAHKNEGAQNTMMSCLCTQKVSLRSLQQCEQFA